MLEVDEIYLFYISAELYSIGVLEDCNFVKVIPHKVLD